MALEDERDRETFVKIDCEGDSLAVLLFQIEASGMDGGTQQEIADWHYWVNQGYEFGYALAHSSVAYKTTSLSYR